MDAEKSWGGGGAEDRREAWQVLQQVARGVGSHLTSHHLLSE